MTLTDCKYYVFMIFSFFSRNYFYFLLVFFYILFYIFIFYLYIIDFYINWIFYFVTAPLNRVTWIHGAIKMLSLLLLYYYQTRHGRIHSVLLFHLIPFHGWEAILDLCMIIMYHDVL